jgi:hypothetical protein
MINEYKINTIAGPQGIFSGYVLFVLGLVTSIFTWAGIFVLLAGALLAFSYYGIFIDTETKSIFTYIKWFGLIKRGDWINYDGSLQIGLESFNRKSDLIHISKKSPGTKTPRYKVVIEHGLLSQKKTLARFNDLSAAKKESEKLKKILVFE